MRRLGRAVALTPSRSAGSTSAHGAAGSAGRRWPAAILIALWVGAIGALAVLQHLTLHTGAYDLAIFDNTIWNSAQGRLFESSVTADSPNHLGQHFSPSLLALVPLYWIYPSPLVLVVSQALLIGLAGLPIYWLARHALESELLALACLLAYLLHPATSFVALFDFHEVAIAAPALSGALYCLYRRRDLPFAVCVAILLLTKEDLGLVVAAIGLLAIVLQRRWRLGLCLIAGGVSWTFLLVKVVIPWFNPVTSTGVYYYASLYAELGSSYREMLSNVLHHPDRVLGLAFSRSRLIYLAQLIAPLGGLPLLGWPMLLVALPYLGLVLLATGLPADLIRLQYSLMLLPPLLMATVLGLRWLRQGFVGQRAIQPGLLAAYLAAAALAGAYFFGPLPFARGFEPGRFTASPRTETARQILAQIPPEASVIAQSEFVPQLSHRRSIQLFGFSDPALRPDYYLLDTDASAFRFPFAQDDETPYQRAIARVAADAEYHLAVDRDGYLVFQRSDSAAAPAQPEAIFGDQIALVSHQSASQTVTAGGELKLTLYWKAQRKPSSDYSLFVHVVGPDGQKRGQSDGYPTGKYLPTSLWEAGRLLWAEWTLNVPLDAPDCECTLVAGLYDLNTMQRLPVTNRAGTSTADTVVLQRVKVVAAR